MTVEQYTKGRDLITQIQDLEHCANDLEEVIKAKDRTAFLMFLVQRHVADIPISEEGILLIKQHAKSYVDNRLKELKDELAKI